MRQRELRDKSYYHGRRLRLLNHREGLFIDPKGFADHNDVVSYIKWADIPPHDEYPISGPLVRFDASASAKMKDAFRGDGDATL